MNENLTRNKDSEIENVLPPASLLVADKQHAVLRYVDLEGIQQSIDYRDLTSSDPFPIPMPIDREGYGTVETSHQFWATGYGDWLNVQTAWNRHARDRRPQRLLDFGCASGRFLRHVLSFSDVEPSGCDFAPANVEWVKRHLSPDLNVVLNSSSARLPWADNFFDIVAAFSVFTHIDQQEQDWLLELRRITHPDGMLYLTIQNQATWEKVVDRPGSLEQLLNANRWEGNLHVSKELFAAPMPAERIVFRMSNDDTYNCNVWHTSQYVETTWSRWFEIEQIADNAHTGFQSPVIMRPKE